MKDEADTIIANWLDPKFKQRIQKLNLKTDFVNGIKNLKIKSVRLINKHWKFRNLMIKMPVNVSEMELWMKNV